MVKLQLDNRLMYYCNLSAVNGQQYSNERLIVGAALSDLGCIRNSKLLQMSTDCNYAAVVLQLAADIAITSATCWYTMVN